MKKVVSFLSLGFQFVVPFFLWILNDSTSVFAAPPISGRTTVELARAMIESMPDAGKTPHYETQSLHQLRVLIRLKPDVLESIEKNGILNFLQVRQGEGVKRFGLKEYEAFYLSQARRNPIFANSKYFLTEPASLYPKFGYLTYEAKEGHSSVPHSSHARFFGDLILVLKKEVLSRTTYSIGSIDDEGHVFPISNLSALQSYHETFQQNGVQMIRTSDGSLAVKPNPEWIETHTWGDLTLSDVDEIWIVKQGLYPLPTLDLKTELSLSRISTQYGISLKIVEYPNWQIEVSPKTGMVHFRVPPTEYREYVFQNDLFAGRFAFVSRWAETLKGHFNRLNLTWQTPWRNSVSPVQKNRLLKWAVNPLTSHSITDALRKYLGRSLTSEEQTRLLNKLQVQTDQSEHLNTLIQKLLQSKNSKVYSSIVKKGMNELSISEKKVFFEFLDSDLKRLLENPYQVSEIAAYLKIYSEEWENLNGCMFHPVLRFFDPHSLKSRVTKVSSELDAVPAMVLTIAKVFVLKAAVNSDPNCTHEEKSRFQQVMRNFAFTEDNQLNSVNVQFFGLIRFAAEDILTSEEHTQLAFAEIDAHLKKNEFDSAIRSAMVHLGWSGKRGTETDESIEQRNSQIAQRVFPYLSEIENPSRVLPISLVLYEALQEPKQKWTDVIDALIAKRLEKSPSPLCKGIFGTIALRVGNSWDRRVIQITQAEKFFEEVRLLRNIMSERYPACFGL